MKVGFSNFANVMVGAAELDYEDCREFQVVCPCCAEPIFKVARPTSGGETHFLSHYRSTAATVSECENRVGAMSSGEIARRNAEGQHQNLAYFLSVVPQEMEALGGGASPLQAAVARQKFLSVDFAAMLQPAVAKQIREGGGHHGTTFGGIWNKTVAELARTDETFAALSAYQRQFRRNVARNVFQTLLTDASKPAFSRILCFAIAAVHESSRSALQAGRGTLADREIVGLIEDMLSANRSRAKDRMGRAMATNSATPIGDGSGDAISVGSRFCAWIVSEIEKALCRVDYVEVLQRVRAAAPDQERLELEAMDRQPSTIAQPR